MEREREWDKWGYPDQDRRHPRPNWLTFLGLALIVVTVLVGVGFGGVVGFLVTMGGYVVAGSAFAWWRFRQSRDVRTR